MIPTLKERNKKLAEEKEKLAEKLKEKEEELEEAKEAMRILKESLKELKSKELDSHEKFIEGRKNEIKGSFAENENKLIIENDKKDDLEDTQSQLIKEEIQKYEDCSKIIGEVKELIAQIVIE